MSLEDKISTDLKAAMKSKDAAALRSIRAIKAQVLLFQTSGEGKALDSDAEIKILQKMVKQRRESLEIFEKQNRPDLAEKEIEEIEVISKYLPKALSEDELAAIVAEVISSTGASGMKDMGKVMGIINQKVAGRADGKAIASLVKSSLMG